ncbi:palmitoyltransferase ZDHHC16B-like isoform X4 [Artemia franciscana]|uniref:palmitoyltransferase ZDHHC16B-like isoform X4 n=1 Tax=Artemia franciscana TaxID=6661 RepID=UPI0032DB89BE
MTKILVAGIAILLFFVVSIAHIIGIPFWWDRSPLATIIIISIGYWLLINVLFHYTMAVRTDPGHPDNLVESHAIENQAPRPRNWRRSAIVFEALITVAVFLALGALTLWHTRLITRNETSIEALENSDVRNKMKESGKLVESHAIENQAPRPRNWRRSAIVFEALITVAVFLALGALTLWHTRLITRNETSIEALENSDVRNKMKESGKIFRNPYNMDL